MQFRIFTLVFAFIFLSEFMSSYQCAQLYSRKQFYCGTKLVQTLSRMCKTYNHSTGGNVLKKRQNGIIETCCQQPCTEYVLSSYCGTLKEEFVIKFNSIAKLTSYHEYNNGNLDNRRN